MKRFFLLLLCVSSLLAGGFDAAQEKLKQASYFVGFHKPTAVSHSTALLFSSEKLFLKPLKYNPFLGLYLLKTPFKKKHYFKVYNKAPQKALAAINPRFIQQGRFIREQVGLNQFAQFSKASMENALITDYCCGIFGISTGGNDVIARAYVEDFLKSKRDYYSEIGVRVKQKGKKVVVTHVIPFLKTPFKVGDELTHLNNKRIKSAEMFMQKILFAKLNTSFKLSYKRVGKTFKITLQTVKRRAGGLLPETFLEYVGVLFNKSLTVQAVDEHAFAGHRGLKLGDKLLSINNTYFTSPQEVRAYLSHINMKEQKFLRLLLTRNDFQFFLEIPLEKALKREKTLL